MMHYRSGNPTSVLQGRNKLLSSQLSLTLTNPQARNPRGATKKDANDPLADMPFWLEDFTDNLEDTELHASAHSSQYSDSERPTIVVTKSRKHSIYTHFPKDRDCDVCLGTKITKASCRRRTGEALVQKSLVTW